jgi:hypothetical protein
MITSTPKRRRVRRCGQVRIRGNNLDEALRTGQHESTRGVAEGSRFRSEAFVSHVLQPIVSELHHPQTYEIEFDSKKYQVEVELLQDTSSIFMSW